VPRGRQLHAARDPLEENDPDVLFEIANRPAQRGLRDMESASSASDVPFLRDRDERLQMSEFRTSPPSPSASGRSRWARSEP
jgi:hypothetical protein